MSDAFFREAKRRDVAQALLQARKDGELASKRILAEEKIKHGVILAEI